MVISGKVESSKSVLLEGVIEGVFIGTDITVAESGTLNGEVECAALYCAGWVEGNIVSSSLKLCKSAQHVGKVTTQKLAIEPGAVLDCILHSGTQQPPTAPDEESLGAASQPMKVLLEDYLGCFDEEHRPCCFEVPWSRRLEMYQHLGEMLGKHKPLIKVIGSAKSGKTTFLKKLLAELPQEFVVVHLEDQVGSVTDILKFVATSLGIADTGVCSSQKDYTDILRDYVLELKKEHRSVLLLVDDCHHMYQATLEGVVRLLSGASDGDYSGQIKEGKLQLVLFGSQELESNMVTTIRDYFEDETNCQFFLDPLSIKDTADYIRLALQMAPKGNSSGVMSVFPNETIKELHTQSGGKISDINLLAQKGLQLACEKQEHKVSLETLREVVKYFQPSEGISS